MRRGLPRLPTAAYIVSHGAGRGCKLADRRHRRDLARAFPAAKQFGVGISTANTWVKRVRETGSVAPGKMGGHRPKRISGEHRLWLLQRIKDGDFTLRGLVCELGERGLKVDYRSVWEFVHAEKLSFKKSVVAGERNRPDIARRRAQWTRYQDRIEPERLVFIDETWTRTNMAPLVLRSLGRLAKLLSFTTEGWHGKLRPDRNGELILLTLTSPPC
jgi:transposase